MSDKPAPFPRAARSPLPIILGALVLTAAGVAGYFWYTHIYVHRDVTKPGEGSTLGLIPGLTELTAAKKSASEALRMDLAGRQEKAKELAEQALVQADEALKLLKPNEGLGCSVRTQQATA